MKGIVEVEENINIFDRFDLQGLQLYPSGQMLDQNKHPLGIIEVGVVIANPLSNKKEKLANKDSL